MPVLAPGNEYRKYQDRTALDLRAEMTGQPVNRQLRLSGSPIQKTAEANIRGSI